MSVLSGYGKYKRYVLTSTGYKLCSQWTSSNTVHFDDGKTAQTKLGAISGITDSLTSTSSNVALSAKAGKSLQDQVTELNTGTNGWLSIINGFTGRGLYCKMGNLVLIAFTAICPGKQSVFANVPELIKPQNEQFNNVWVQLFNAPTGYGQLCGNITIKQNGDLILRNWNGDTLTAKTTCRGSLVYRLN